MSKEESSHTRRARKAPGLAPGTLVHIGKKMVEKPSIAVTLYDKESLVEVQVDTAAEARKLSQNGHVLWVNVIGLHDTSLVEQFGEAFGLHPLLLEDVVNTEQRPKAEVYPDSTFVVVKALHGSSGKVVTEHVSIVLGQGFVITFQEREGNVFNPVLERIRQRRKIRERKADYLCYALIDSVVDHYYQVFEHVAEHVEDLESEALNDPDEKTMQKILALKREMIVLQKATWPVREAVSALVRGDNPMFSKETQVYLRDVYDHAVQVIESVQSFRDIINGMMDLYMSSMSNRMNEVMKVLTIIATIFIPLTFIAGVYGMNFQHMPELGWKYGYFIVWAIMLGLGIGLLVFFRRKGWL